MFGGWTMETIREAVGAYAGAFDPALVSAADAQRIVADAAAAENMLATVKALAAARVAETDLWRKEGDRSPAHHLARRSGTSVSKAREALDTAAALRSLPELDSAVRRGEVSPAQAAPIAEAAGADPRAESRLVERARRASLGELRDECARTKAAAAGDAEARHKALHASRHLRRRRCADGAGELLYRSTLDEVAEVFSVVRGFAEEVFRAARAEGRREPEEAYLADGLLDMARAAAEAGLTGAGPVAGAGGVGDDGQGRTRQADGDAGGDGGNCAGARVETRTDGSEAVGGSASPFERDSEPGAAEPAQTRAGGPEAPGQPEASHEAGSAAGPVADGQDPAPAAAMGAMAGDESPAGTTAAAHAPPPGRRRRVPRPAKVLVRIDWDALVRGRPVEGEVCEIAGLGPVAVSVVRAMIESGDAFVAAVVTKGVDVVNVAHLGRRLSAHQMSGLEWRDPACSVLGCNDHVRLEADHRVEWASSKVTVLSCTDHLCGHHHDLKTFKGWALVDGAGKRPMVPPDDPRHPANARAGPDEAGGEAPAGAVA